MDQVFRVVQTQAQFLFIRINHWCPFINAEKLLVVLFVFWVSNLDIVSARQSFDGFQSDKKADRSLTNRQRTIANDQIRLPKQLAQFDGWEGNRPIFRNRRQPHSSGAQPGKLDPIYPRNFRQNHDGSSFWDYHPRPKPYYGGSYRTMCVRFCDGYYWPISFSTDPSQFLNDEAVCQSSCNSPVGLFYYRNPGAGIDDMESLDGLAYRRLINAYLYRKNFLPECRCRPEPWTEVAKAQHEFYRTGRKSQKHAGNAPEYIGRRSNNFPGNVDRDASEAEIDTIRERWRIREQSRSNRSFKIITIDPRAEKEADGNDTFFDRMSKYYRGRQRNYRTFRYLFPDQRRMDTIRSAN